MFFPMVMYSCKNWTIKRDEHRRIGACELWCWRIFLRVPWTAGRSTSRSSVKSILNTHWKGWCWSWNSSILIIWCEQLTQWKSPWSWERLRAEGEKDVRGWDGRMASLMQWTCIWANFWRWWRTEIRYLYSLIARTGKLGVGLPLLE